MPARPVFLPSVAVQLLERGRRVRSRPEVSSLLARLKRIDLVLIATTGLLSALGVVMVYSASRSYAISIGLSPSYFLKRQIFYTGLALVCMVVCASIDYHRLEQWAYLLYGAAIVSLIAVFGVGHSQLGAVRWIALGPVTIQPSEFAVLALIMVIALYISRHEGELGVRRLGAMLGLAAIPMLLVVKQPDLGTTMVLGIVLLWLFFLAGVRLAYLGALLVLVVAAFFLGIKLHLIHGYQLDRLRDYLHQNDPSASDYYNLNNSKLAIGAGGMRGTGLFKGQVTNLDYVPVQYADFIFSAIGEQLGFIGATALLGLFTLLGLRIFLAMQRARDSLGRLICGGVLAFIVFSVFENIGMTIGLTPITGIPLPFVSYGGSALFAFYGAIGLVLNVNYRRGARW
jgi:rod shape determining protein RodA